MENNPGVYVRIAQKSDHLKECFSSILKGNDVLIHPQIVQDIYNKELQIKLSQLNEVLQCVLLESLVYFISIWPGWSKYDEYRNGQLTFEAWFDKFRQYLILQTKYVIRNEPQARGTSATASNETHIVNGIAVAGPPSAQDLDFRVNDGNVVLVKSIKVAEEEHIKFRELVNWPNSSITIIMGKWRITRQVVLETTRFLSTPENVPPEPEHNDVIIVKGQQVNNSKILFNTIRELITRLVGVLRFVIGYNGELTHLLNLFTNELEGIDLENNKHVHGHVYFLENRKRYHRQKLLPGSNVSLYERFEPKIKYVFGEMDSVMDVKERKDFMRKIKLQLRDTAGTIRQILLFNCDFCNCNYSSSDLLIKHFVRMHGLGCILKCATCGQSFSIPFLSRCSWDHECSIPTSTS